MSIAVRKTITVPADGVYEPVPVAGQVVYVEQSPINTPDGAPTFHLDRGGDGAPLYSRSALAWLPRFKRFYVRGTADSAGETLYLLVYDDPCTEGVYGSGGFFEPNPCGESESDPAAVEPTGTPTHALRISGSEIVVHDSAGATVRTIVTGKTFIGKIYVDFGAGWIFYGDRSSGTGQVRRVNFDGTGDTLIVDTTHTGSASYHVSWDAALGRLVVSNGSRIWTVNKDGSNLTLVSTAATTWRGANGIEDGIHFASSDGSNFRLRDYASGSQLTFGGSHQSSDSICDPLRGFMYSIANPASSGAIAQVPLDFSSFTGVVTGITGTGDNKIYKYGRWAYFRRSSAGLLSRMHLDDVSIVEDLFNVSNTGNLHPWWE